RGMTITSSLFFIGFHSFLSGLFIVVRAFQIHIQNNKRGQDSHEDSDVNVQMLHPADVGIKVGKKHAVSLIWVSWMKRGVHLRRWSGQTYCPADVAERKPVVPILSRT